jgi:hypothetical protein
MSDPSFSAPARRGVYDRLSAHLAALSDDAVAELIESGRPVRTSRHGAGAVLEVEGVPVFVKQVALTDLERAPGNIRSTANLFDLPLYYQYGVGSTGFGAWRELDVSLKVTDWVRSSACPHFPLLHHWRVLPKPAPGPPTPEQLARLDQVVEYWGGASSIRARRERLRDASAKLVLCLEYFPETLTSWLQGLAAAGGEGLDASFAMVETQLSAIAAFVNAHGMLHFDLHGLNVLTDGEQLFAADFGLAICADFELSRAEREFFDRHQAYDRGFVSLCLVAQFDAVGATASPATAAMIDAHRPAADIMRGFLEGLRDGSKTTPCPMAELERALAAQGAGSAARFALD